MANRLVSDDQVSTDASALLGALLDTTTTTPMKRRPKEKLVSIAEAKTNPILEIDTGRAAVRVLFVTTDTSVLTEATKSLDGFTTISEVFDEVHIMVLRTGIPSKHPVLRVGTRMWLYTVTAKHEWQLPLAAWRMMQQELVFADGFRPDLVVAREPYESALVAYGAGRVYGRPIQLHLPNERGKRIGRWRRWLRRWLVPRFPSVRVDAEEALTHLQTLHPTCQDVAVLPRFRDYAHAFTGEKESYLQQKYPQFNFIILYIGALTHTSAAFVAIDAVRSILRNPRVGFVIVGNGSGVTECERRATLLGIQEQVVIERRSDDIKQYLASADALLVIETTPEADEIVLYGAAAGAPMVMTETAMRKDLFTTYEAAFLTPKDHPQRIQEALARLLNDNALRLQMRHAARRVATERLITDPTAYRASFRDSVERAVILQHESAVV